MAAGWTDAGCTCQLHLLHSMKLLSALFPTASADWRQQALLQWRVQRKRALRQTVERLAALLSGEPQPPAAAEAPQQAQQEGGHDAAAAEEGTPRDEL